MTRADVVIAGGRVVSAGVPERASVAVTDGRISEIRDSPRPIPAKLVIDATGKLVLPGVVDAHVHVDTPGPADKPLGAYADGFESLSRSAAFGGVTTVMPFVFSSREIPPARYLEQCRRLAEAESWVDFAFHFGLVGRRDVEAVPDLVRAGVTSFKAMMDYRRQGIMLEDPLLAAAMAAVAGAGGMLMVHAEDGALIDCLEDRARAAGDTSPPAYAGTRPAAAEHLAVVRAIALAAQTGCPLYVVHLSTGEGLALCRGARAGGRCVLVETCPHYLLLTRDELQPDRLGPLAKIGPPLREPADNAVLWQGVLDGTVDVLGSDHAPRTRSAKLLGAHDIFAAPFGAPGTETLLPVLLDAFLARGLHPARLVRLVSEAPARIFRLYPRKGVIAVGADADIVIVDPDASWTVEPERLHTQADYSLWSGRRLRGKPVTTLVRGKVVVMDGEAAGAPGWGRFLGVRTASGER